MKLIWNSSLPAQCQHHCLSSSPVLFPWIDAVTSSLWPAFPNRMYTKVTSKACAYVPFNRSFDSVGLWWDMGIVICKKTQVMRMILLVVNYWSIISSRLLPGMAVSCPCKFSILTKERYYSAAAESVVLAVTKVCFHMTSCVTTT